MKATKEQVEKGRGIAKQMKTDTLYINVNGEYFTTENLAQLSVNGKKDKYQKLSYVSSTSKKEAKDTDDSDPESNESEK